jgi:molybdopterin converting factor subunit 1
VPAVQVHYFAQLRDRLGCAQEGLDLPPTVDAAGILAAVRALHPQHAALIERCRVAIDLQFATSQVALRADSELALIPPVSGG